MTKLPAIRTLPALAALAALAACVPVSAPEPARPAPDTYFALGTEPGWTLEIARDRLNYAGDYGDTIIAVANPGARPSFNGHRFVTPRLTVDVTFSPCSDGMSERRYADRVTVTADGKTVRGCGGALLPPVNLARTRWRILAINGVDVATDDQPPMLIFDNDSIAGNAGCNSFSAAAALRPDGFTAGPVRATRMACTGAAMTQERAFFALLAGPVTTRATRDGRLLLTGAEGRSALLERVE